VLSVRGPMGRLFNLASLLTRPRIPVVIPLARISAIDVQGGRPTLITFHCTDPELDGIIFGSVREPRTLVAALAAHGIEVREAS
jgi:hypothetical protein